MINGKGVERRGPSYAEDDEVEEPVDGGALELGFPAVLHQFRVPAGEDDDAVAPLRVAEDAPAQQDLVVIQRVLPSVPRQLTCNHINAKLGLGPSS